jgi:hypothetical protein
LKQQKVSILYKYVRQPANHFHLGPREKNFNCENESHKIDEKVYIQLWNQQQMAIACSWATHTRIFTLNSLILSRCTQQEILFIPFMGWRESKSVFRYQTMNMQQIMIMKTVQAIFRNMRIILMYYVMDICRREESSWTLSSFYGICKLFKRI